MPSVKHVPPVVSGDNENTDVATESESETKKGWCNLYYGNTDAIGWSWLGAGRGMVVMSNIYMSSAILWLAANAAGCDTDPQSEKTCTNRVYGLVPSSFLTTVSIAAGLTSAFLMPICGAFVDFTPYRRMVGIVTIVIIVAIQFVQVFINETTWLAMTILQGVAIFFYQLQVVAVYAYLPEIARQVGQTKMTTITSNFTMVQFTSQLTFLVTIVVIQIILKSPSVRTAQISQGLNTVTSIFLFSIGWFMYMQPRPAARELPEGSNMLTGGFRQLWNTSKNVHRHFKKGLRWYFLALAFAEASVQAITTLSIIYLQEAIKLNTMSVGIFFIITLLGTIPGTRIALRVSNKLNPNASLKFALVILFLILMIGVLVLESLPKYCPYIWGFCIGVALGWFYPTENLFFSMVMPKGQEAELSGLFVYCTQILSWLPPLLFQLMVEANVPQEYGIIVASSFLLPAAGFLMLTGTWDEILEESASGALALAEAKADSITSVVQKSGP